MEKLPSINDRFSGYSSAQLIEMGVRARKIEFVYVDEITEEEALYDPSHSGALAESILLEKVQLSPVLLRAREIDGSIVYDIIDGFHRRQGIKRIKEEWRMLGPLIQKVFHEISWDNHRLSGLIKDDVLKLKDVVKVARKFEKVPIKEDVLIGNGEYKTVLSESEVSELIDWYKPGAEGKIEAVVLYGVSDEKMFDLRVLAASSVQKIKFARMAKWMQKSFESTNWTNFDIKEMIKINELSLAQVFVLANTDSSGKILGLSPESVIELKAWAKKKASEWNKPLSSLALEMRTVELADPDLVAMVTKGGGGRTGRRGVLTHAKLKAVIEHLPGEWDVQKRLVDVVLNHNYVSEKISFLAWILKNAIDLNDFETIDRVYNNPQFYFPNLDAMKLARERENRKIEEDARINANKEKVNNVPIKYYGPLKEYPREIVIGDTNQLKDSFKKIVYRQARIIRELKTRGDSKLLSDITLVTTVDGKFQIDTTSRNIKRDNKTAIPLSREEAIVLSILTTYKNIKLNSFLISLLSEGEVKSREAKGIVDELKEKFINESEELSHQLTFIKSKSIGWWIWQRDINQSDY